MVDSDTFYAKWSPRLLSVLRMVAALLFMQHGSQKLFDFPDASKAGPDLISLLGLAGVLEFFGGALILLGLFTRPVAFLLAGQMAVAYFMAHATEGFWPLLNKGELAVLYCFLFLYLFATGPGPWSAEHLWRRRS
jgi:putative oxidoreductase